jgi:hypothetical protein
VTATGKSKTPNRSAGYAGNGGGFSHANDNSASLD